MTDRITAPPKGAPTVDQTGTQPKQQSQAQQGLAANVQRLPNYTYTKGKNSLGDGVFALIYDGNLTVADGEVFEAFKDCITRELKSKGVTTEQASKKRPVSGGYRQRWHYKDPLDGDRIERFTNRLRDQVPLLGMTSKAQLLKFLKECPNLAAAVGSGFIHCFEKDGKAQIALRDRTNKDGTTTRLSDEQIAAGFKQSLNLNMGNVANLLYRKDHAPCKRTAPVSTDQAY